jgi:hypothetical protein
MNNLKPNDLNLVMAVNRLRSVQWGWATLFTALIALSLGAIQSIHFLAAYPRQAGFFLPLTDVQPACLALVTHRELALA